MKHSAKLDLDNYLPYLVNRVGTIIAEQFGEEALAPYGLSIAMWRVMAVLASNGGQRQIDLAGLTSIDASTLSRLVTRLVGLGVVSRTRSASSTREGASGCARPCSQFLSVAGGKPNLVANCAWRGFPS